jgi:hypothetical protein
MLTWIIAAALACDQAAVGRVVEAIDHVSPTYYEEIAAAGFSEACAGPVAASALHWSQVPPEARRLADAQAVLAAPELWTAACPAGVSVVAQSVQLTPADARAWVYDQCDLGRLGWFSRAQWLGGEAQWLPLLAGAHLRAERVPEDRIGVIVGAWLGVGPDGAAPPPEPELLPFLPALVEMAEIPPEEEGLGLFRGAPSAGALDDLRPFEPAQLGAADGETRADTGLYGVLGALDSGFDPITGAAGLSWEQRPRVVDLATPTWTRAARKVGGICIALVTVAADGQVRSTDVITCPRALQRPVLAAVGASTFAPSVIDGRAAAGMIQVEFTAE